MWLGSDSHSRQQQLGCADLDHDRSRIHSPDILPSVHSLQSHRLGGLRPIVVILTRRPTKVYVQ
jgi:hypothetical protein